VLTLSNVREDRRRQEKTGEDRRKTGEDVSAQELRRGGNIYTYTHIHIYTYTRLHIKYILHLVNKSVSLN
jgi:hypothetical protein